MFVVAARYVAMEGEEDAVLGILEQMGPLSRAEPGCRFYQAHRSADDPRVFFLYEQYVDRGGYEAHMETPHFKERILGDAVPRLETRERAFYETIA